MGIISTYKYRCIGTVQPTDVDRLSHKVTVPQSNCPHGAACVKAEKKVAAKEPTPAEIHVCCHSKSLRGLRGWGLWRPYYYQRGSVINGTPFAADRYAVYHGPWQATRLTESLVLLLTRRELLDGFDRISTIVH
jgi:hypothetical protein